MIDPNTENAPGVSLTPELSSPAAFPAEPASSSTQDPQATSPRLGKPFPEFPLDPDVQETLERMGIRNATPIQELVIEPILAGLDVMGKAETGTGKTIGFGAPLVGKIDTQRVAVQALVLTPTRELAQQVAGVIEELGRGRKLGVALVVGGVHASEQVLKLRSRSQVVVGTPGRVLDFLRDRTLSLVWCETVVLDEADRMLDMGFIDDVGAILDRIPPERQTLLFSATIPPGVEKLARRYMRDPKMFSTARGLSAAREIRQCYQEVEFRDKLRALRKILDENPADTCLIFCNTRRQVIDLDRMLFGHGYAAGALHGDQEQDVRFKILEAFRRREILTLVATDVASRGLDVEEIARVINYEVPDEEESYVHRIGRTGRALRTGIAITLVAGKEMVDWRRIVRATGFPVEVMGAGFVPSAANEGSSDESEGRGRFGRSGSRRGGGGGGGGGGGRRREGPGDRGRSSGRREGGHSHARGPGESHGRRQGPERGPGPGHGHAQAHGHEPARGHAHDHGHAHGHEQKPGHAAHQGPKRETGHGGGHLAPSAVGGHGAASGHGATSAHGAASGHGAASAHGAGEGKGGDPKRRRRRRGGRGRSGGGGGGGHGGPKKSGG